MIQSKAYQLVLMDSDARDGWLRSIQTYTRAIAHLLKEVPIVALTASAMIDIKGKVWKSQRTILSASRFNRTSHRPRSANTYCMREAPAKTDGYKINFDLYTQGDLAFKRELATLLVQHRRTS